MTVIAPCKVRVGNVETSNGGRQVFGAVVRTDTDIAVLIRRSLKAVGRSNDTELIAFIHGCPGLRSILAEAGVMTPPIADWFHIAMRLQHAKQAAILSGQSAWLVNYAKRYRAGLRGGTSE